MSALVSNILTIYEVLARVFLKMLDADRLWWEVRTFDDVMLEDGTKREDPALTRTFKMSRTDFKAGSPKLAKLERLNQLGAGVFVTINRTDGKGKRAENVTEVTALFADTDGAPLEPLLALEPHIVVQSSPGNWHVYWRTDDCALDEFTPTQEAIIAKFGTDKKVKDLPRVMRLPGFYHCKGEPELVTFPSERQPDGSETLKHMDPARTPYTVKEVVLGLGLSVGAKRAKPARALKGPVPKHLEGIEGNISPPDPPPPETPEEIAKVRAMLAAIKPDCDRDTWRNTVWAVLAHGWDCAEQLAREWSEQGGKKWDEAVFDRIVTDFDPLGGIRHRSLNYYATTPGPWRATEVTTNCEGTGLDGDVIPPTGKPSTLADLNARYFLSQIGGGVYIFDERAKHIVDGAMSKQAFELKYNNKTHDGKPLGTAWLRWGKRRDYEEVVFNPSGKSSADEYNLWRGFAIEPRAGDCDPIFKHIYQVWCGGNRAQFNYAICWMAYTVQFPHIKPEVAIVLRSDEGSGKNIIADMVRKFFGRHGYTSATKEHVAGHFNAHLLDKIFVILDEAYFAGDHGAGALVKALISNPEMGYEPKGKPAFTAPNYAHVIIVTNNEWAVPAGKDARRYAVLDVSMRRKEDFAYFKSLREHIDNGGGAAFLDRLLKLDLTGFDPRVLPQTVSLADQRKQTLLSGNPVKAWWLGCLTEGGFALREGVMEWDDGEKGVDADLVRQSYEHATRRARHAPQFDQAMKDVRALLPSKSLKKSKPRAGGGLRRHIYHLPPLDVARAKFTEIERVEIVADDASED